MKIIEVSNKKHIREFLDIPKKIYANNPYHVLPLEKDIELVFNPEKNKFFRHGSCTRWILQNEQGTTIGRVAAFVNEKHVKQFKRPVGGMGFFEVIDNKEAAFLLLDTCKNWLADKGMNSMDGPINFGERDKFWGLIIENFERAPYYGQNFNPDYYVPFFEEYGFQIFFKQLIFTRSVHQPVQEKYRKRAEKLKADPEFSLEHLNLKNMEKYTEDFRVVYNEAWGKREGDTFKGMSTAQSKMIMKSMKPIIDEDICVYVYHNNRPIAFFISLPEINEVFVHLKGKFGWLQKMETFLRLKMQKRKVAIGLAFGITPEFQGQGVEGLIFDHLAKKLQDQKNYNEYIITWIGDFNSKMVNIIEAIGCQKEQEMATYRYLFNRAETFERHPVV
ncbi:MAG: hypothetical protein ACJAY8_000545 [Sphingobacteriales bacterium]|jgi:hypothetical protein